MHSTHSAWSERKGQWPRVPCATSPWELRLLDHGSPVHCKFEEKQEKSAAFISPDDRQPCGVQSLKTVSGQWHVLESSLRFGSVAIIGNVIINDLCCVGRERLTSNYMAAGDGNWCLQVVMTFTLTLSVSCHYFSLTVSFPLLWNDLPCRGIDLQKGDFPKQFPCFSIQLLS